MTEQGTGESGIFQLPSHLFTVRVWLEDLGHGRVEWRGKVQHVTNGRTRYFRDWETLVQFIKETLPAPNNNSPGDDSPKH